jgi:hypothetical protein
MNNEPVAWMNPKSLECGYGGEVDWEDTGCIPLYTQDQLEEAKKLGMQQERAMWELAASTQEIMDTHPVKEHFEDKPQAEELHEIMQSNAELTDEEILEIASPMFECVRYPSTALDFARAILRKAQEK